jgi:hypothetical protein
VVDGAVGVCVEIEFSIFAYGSEYSCRCRKPLIHSR